MPYALAVGVKASILDYLNMSEGGQMSVKELARPIAMIFLVVALIVGAVLEAVGYPVAEWFRVFAISLVGEWFIERGIRKGRGK